MIPFPSRICSIRVNPLMILNINIRRLLRSRLQKAHRMPLRSEQSSESRESPHSAIDPIYFHGISRKATGTTWLSKSPRVSSWEARTYLERRRFRIRRRDSLPKSRAHSRSLRGVECRMDRGELSPPFMHFSFTFTAIIPSAQRARITSHLIY